MYIVMTMTNTSNNVNIKEDADPLLKYCRGTKEYLKGKKNLHKLRSYSSLENPDYEEKEEKDVDMEIRIIFEIDGDEKTQIYELMYVSTFFVLHPH